MRLGMTLADAPESTVMPRRSFILLVPVLVVAFALFFFAVSAGKVFTTMEIVFWSFGRNLNGRDTDGTRDSKPEN